MIRLVSFVGARMNRPSSYTCRRTDEKFTRTTKEWLHQLSVASLGGAVPGAEMPVSATARLRFPLAEPAVIAILRVKMQVMKNGPWGTTALLVVVPGPVPWNNRTDCRCSPENPRSTACG